MNTIELTADQRYEINDFLTTFCERHGIAVARQFDTDEQYDAMLNDATWAMVEVLELGDGA